MQRDIRIYSISEGNHCLFNGGSSSESLMEEMKLNEVLLIKQYLCLPLSLSLFCFLFLTHTMAQCCVCSRAGGLGGLISKLARYSHKTDRPTNYPKNYNILMFTLTAMFTRN